MKKYIIIAASVVLASMGGVYATNSLHGVKSHSECEVGMKCTQCKGTGWKGQFKCFFCKGSGANGSY
jgi:hypothetical protein